MSCLTPEQLALYLDDRLDAADRQRAEEHLSRCVGCRRQLVLAHHARRPAEPSEPVPEEILRTARALARRHGVARRGPARWWWGSVAALLVAALGLLVFDLDRRAVGPPIDDPETLRAAGSLELELLAPQDGAEVAGQVLELRWGALPGAWRYTVTLVDGLGNILARVSTAEPWLSLDTSTSGPALAPGTSCFWYVTAELEDGTSLASEPRQLVLADTIKVR